MGVLDHRQSLHGIANASTTSDSTVVIVLEAAPGAYFGGSVPDSSLGLGGALLALQQLGTATTSRAPATTTVTSTPMQTTQLRGMAVGADVDSLVVGGGAAATVAVVVAATIIVALLVRKQRQQRRIIHNSAVMKAPTFATSKQATSHKTGGEFSTGGSRRNLSWSQTRKKQRTRRRLSNPDRASKFAAKVKRLLQKQKKKAVVPVPIRGEDRLLAGPRSNVAPSATATDLALTDAAKTKLRKKRRRHSRRKPSSSHQVHAGNAREPHAPPSAAAGQTSHEAAPERATVTVSPSMKRRLEARRKRRQVTRTDFTMEASVEI
eukprot:INCI3607.2.p1 GENE.INCI3607.2~~INCI3607.2.p1  ORF type:complete len:321 (+),score=48.83 INCI3607.2:556-1518(+)